MTPANLSGTESCLSAFLTSEHPSNTKSSKEVQTNSTPNAWKLFNVGFGIVVQTSLDPIIPTGVTS